MLKFFLFLLFVFSSVWMYGQNATVKGHVSDDSGEPLPGITVVVKGNTGTTKSGTITDIDGSFSINLSSNQKLVFSLVGMATQEITYVGQQNMEVVMQSNDKMLDDVVVIGYQTIRKADLTGAVSTFNPNLMKNQTVTGTVGDALGILPGVNVRGGGAPGSEGKIEIRGTGTFGNSNPLYVVDGVISEANRDFNFNDVESIQVLKDASAAAIYGSRAGNGVIIISTKRGKEGKMNIDVSSRLTWQTLPRYNLTNRDQWIELNNLARANAGLDNSNHFDANTDWQDVAFKTGFIQDQNISFSGAGKESQYFISANYQSNSGTTIGTDSKRITFRTNTSASRNFTDDIIFRIGENMALSNYSVNELNSNPIIDVFRMLPTIPVYDASNPGGFGYGNGNRNVTFGTNPVAREALEDTRNSNLRIRGNGFAELDMFKMFKYKFNLGFDFSNDKYLYLRRIGNWQYNQPPAPSSLNRNQAQSRQLIFDNTLEYNKTFGKHVIGAVFGVSYQTDNYEKVWGAKNDILTSGNGDYFEQLQAALKDPVTGSYAEQGKIFSLFGRVNYNIDERYLFSFTMRRDETSRFGPDYRVGYFPSISGAWRISKEKFFKSSLIDDLKIRANYGILGTSNIGYWDYLPLMNLYPQAVFGMDKNLHNGIIATKLANPDLRWEKMKQINVGVDVSMIQNKLQFSLDYFIKNTSDVLAPIPILDATGNSGGNPFVNAVTLDNRGVELAVTWRDNIGKDWSYTANVNGSYLKNKLQDIAYGLDRFSTTVTYSKIGRPIGEWYLVKTDGIFQSQAEVDSYVNSKGQKIQPNAKPGDIRYVNVNDDDQITDDDRQYCGQTIPKFQLGINVGLQYKDFDFQMMLGGAFGHKIFNGPRSTYDRFDDNSNYRTDYDPWTPDNPNAKDPRPLYGDARNTVEFQDRWLENGNYLRVKQLALGYNIPKSALGKTIKQARVYVNVQNLLTFTSYTGLDPEFLNPDIWTHSYDNGAFPNPKGFTIGTQITF